MSCLKVCECIVSSLNLMIRRVQSNYELRNYLIQVVEEISFHLKVLMRIIIDFLNQFYDFGILLNQVLDTMLEKLISIISMRLYDSWLYHKSIHFLEWHTIFLIAKIFCWILISFYVLQGFNLRSNLFKKGRVMQVRKVLIS